MEEAIATQFHSEQFSDQSAVQSEENPFKTRNFARALAALGEVWLFAACSQGEPRNRCPGVLNRGRFTSKLTLYAVPDRKNQDVFWQGIISFCKRKRVDVLEINTFGCKSVALPRLGPELWRRGRLEYILNLDNEDRFSLYDANHRRNIRRASKSEVGLRVSTHRDACRDHILLIGSSMSRRRSRGERLPSAAREDLCAALLNAGAGAVFQAVRDDKVLSSMLVLLTDSTGYYHSAGTSNEGRKIGASHFLVDRVAEHLRESGRNEFNLGGVATGGSGLARFKAGFGARIEELEALTVLTCHPFKRALLKLLWHRQVRAI